MKKLAPITALLLLAAALLWASAASAHVYWTNYSTGKIGRADANGSGVDQSFIAVTGSPSGVAVDGEHVYWTNRSDSIGRAGLDGANPNQSFISGVSSPFGIAVNNQYAYWANAGTSALGLANLDFVGNADPSFLGAGSPFGVAIDSQHVYWSDSSTKSIGRAAVDGGDAEPSFITGTDLAIGVAVDSQHIYWANYETGTIGRANFDGSGVDEQFITGADRPQGVAVDGQHIFWTNLGTNSIGRARINGSEVNEYFVGGASAPNGVAAEPVATGTATPSSESLDFGREAERRSGPARPLTITNGADADLQVDHVEIAGANRGDFSISSDSCSQATLGAGDSCTVEVRFGPSARGARAATLRVPSNDSAGPLEVGLSGSGYLVPPSASRPSRQTAPTAPPSTTSHPNSPRHGVHVKCAVTTVRVACKVRFAFEESARVRWGLTRGGRIYRRGFITASHGSATIRIAHPGRLPSGRYQLRIAGLRRATAIVLRRRS